MQQEPLLQPIPLCHLLLLIVIFLVAPYPSLSQTYSSDCAPIPYSCGDVNFTLSYPFRLHSQPDYCGHPAFSLNCINNNSTLILPINRNIYKVKYVNTLNRLLTIINIDFVDQSCPAAYQNTTTLDTSLYDYDEYNRNLTVYFNCTAPSTIPVYYEIGCLLGVTGKHSYYRLDNGSFPDVLGRCSSIAVIPMTLEAASLFENGNLSFGAALQEGFGVRWTVGSDWCGSCVRSGGLCGFNASDPLAHTCLCTNASYIDTCNQGNNNEKNKTAIIIAGSIAAACGFLLACVLCYLLYRQHKKRRQNPPSTPVFRTASSEPSSTKDTKFCSIMHPTHVFSYTELQEATNCFDASQELGDGGFATVYKGNLRDGRTVAVKRLYDSNYKRVEKFINEVAILSRLRHQNLVTLYGCTSHDSRELLLVYELVPNGTVADHLHGLRKGFLTWPLRMGIAIETAEALAYLHAVKPPIIHRDVKTNNILLDNSFHVKVADFGLSRNFPADVTHVSTVPQGTPGYLDPQYHQYYQLTDKSDVYSFGVVLVELISSKMAVDINRHQDEINLASMALNKIRNQKLEQLVDPGLGYQSNCEMKRMITSVAEVAFRCLQMDRDMRPTIKEVLETLKTIEGKGCKVGDGRTSVSVPFSPDSVIDKWGSGYTTASNNASGSF